MPGRNKEDRKKYLLRKRVCNKSVIQDFYAGKSKYICPRCGQTGQRTYHHGGYDEGWLEYSLLCPSCNTEWDESFLYEEGLEPIPTDLFIDKLSEESEPYLTPVEVLEEIVAKLTDKDFSNRRVLCFYIASSAELTAGASPFEPINVIVCPESYWLEHNHLPPDTNNPGTTSAEHDVYEVNQLLRASGLFTKFQESTYEFKDGVTFADVDKLLDKNGWNSICF